MEKFKPGDGANQENKESLVLESKVLSAQELMERVYKGEILPQDNRFLSIDDGGVFKYLFLDEVADYRNRERIIYPVVENENKIIGIAGLGKDPYKEKNLWVKFVSVDPAYQNHGAASKLLEAIFTYAKENGYSLQTSRYTDVGILKLRKKVHELAQSMGVPLLDEYKDQKPLEDS